MASCTVRIFSASSSGISMSKASSKAMTSSTVSSESAPRSSTKDALLVTSPSSTPSCSTMICFTLSSTPAIVSPIRPPRSGLGSLWLLAYLGMLVDVVDGILHGADFFGGVVRDLDVEVLFERHHKLDLVERIGAEVVGEGRAGRHLGFFHAELLGDDLFYFFHDFFLLVACHRN